MNSILLVVVLGLGMSTTAWSVPILVVGGPFDGQDVGGIDVYLDEIAGMSSGKQTETNWVNGILGTEFVKEDLIKDEDTSWYLTDMANVIAFQLQSGPGHYLIKNAQLHVLFQNVFNFDWGVINLGSISGNINLGDDMEISHVSEFGEATQVPEPGTLALLGAALLGFALTRRRQSIS